jgi:eukaryotic-like serine/threonine-protein kinase
LHSESLLLALPDPRGKVATDWSADGRFLLFSHISSFKTWYDIWALPMTEDKTPFPVVQTPTPADERDGQFSPDGRWIAYESDESGRSEIYLQAFPKPDDDSARSRAAVGRRCGGGPMGGSSSISRPTAI